MNAIAGILIGIVNKTWLGRIIAPFLWGFVWYFRVLVFKSDYYNNYLETTKGKSLKWGMSPKISFFFTEYTTALITSLLFSIIAGLVYDLIIK